MQLENFSVQAGVQIALEYDDSEDSDSSNCESEHSTEKSSTCRRILAKIQLSTSYSQA